VLELQTALFHDLIDIPPCGECKGSIWPILGDGPCERPYGLDRNGMAVCSSRGENLVVSWPGCPRRWEKVRQIGAELTSIAGIARWAVERGICKAGQVPAWAARLCRHYLNASEVPGNLRIARETEQKRLEDKARGITR